MKISINEHKTGIVFLLSLCLLFTFSLISAEVETSDVFKVNDVIAYNKPCINNGTWCSSLAKCNYTFYNLDNSININNKLATNVGSDGASIWQYNITHTKTGKYKVDMVCVDGSLMGSETLYYEVTGSGVTEGIGFYIIILCVSFGLVIFGISIADAPFTLFGSFGLYFVSLYILFNGIDGTKDNVTTWAIGLIILGIAMYTSTKASYELIAEPSD